MKRLAASFAVAGRDRGLDDATRRSVVQAAAREYREAMKGFAAMRHIDIWYTRLDVGGILDRFAAEASSKELRQFQANAAKARTKDSVRALNMLCQTVDGEPRIVGRPPVITPIEDVLPGAEHHHLEDVIRNMIGYTGARRRATGVGCSRNTATCTPPARSLA